jgi:transposase
MRPATPRARELTSLVLRNPDDLSGEDRQTLHWARSSCQALERLADHVTGFAKMLVHRRGEHLNAWMAAVDADDHPELRSFVAGLRRDYDAVRNGLTVPHSSGPVEGQVNRIKMLKRQIYGRANHDLLRKRVLLAT